MSILGAWTSISDFYAFAGTVVMTTASKLAPYVKEGVQVTATAAPIRAVLPTPVSDAWLSFHFYGESSAFGANATGQLLRIRDTETGQTLFQLDFDNIDDFSLESWNGTSFVEQSVFTAGVGGVAVHKMDVHVKLDDVSGVVNVYLDGALILAMSGDTIFTSSTTFNTIELCRPALDAIGFGQVTFSALIVADEDTRAMVFHQAQASGAGATTGWTSGSYTDVTKLGRDDNTFIKSETADQSISFVMDDVNSALNAYTPRAVVLSARTRKGTTGPQNMQGIVRQSGNDFTTANISGISPGYGSRQAVMNTNPATSTDWLISEINANEFGLKSVA